jgi:ACR3 family arsenite efflux pump ArsB
MLFFVFLTVDIKEISKSFLNVRFSIAALVINFIISPLITLALSKRFLAGEIDLQIGFIMLMVTPCTDWYLIFTGLANGNVTLGASILPLNLILQIVLLPVYVLWFMGTAVSFSLTAILQSIVFVLCIPLLTANLVKLIAKMINWQNRLGTVLKISDDIQGILLYFAIIAMFASQGSLLLGNTIVFVKLLPPLILFFITLFLLAFFTGKIIRLSFTDSIPLIFTTSARNSPISLVIATITFPLQPVIALVLVMGPLIELPILAINAVLLKRMGNRLKNRYLLS